MKKIVPWCLLLLVPALLSAQNGSLSLEDLLKLALERNPKVKSVNLEAEAASFRSAQEKSLPDPMVGFTLKNMGFPAFTIGQEVMSGFGLSFTQAIPFPGKLRLKGEIAAKAYERRKEVRNAVILGVLKDVKTAYFELYVLHRSVAILGEQKAFLQKALELTETKYAVGNGAQSDVMKAMVEIAKMDEMITAMADTIKFFEARINLLLDFPPDTPLGMPQDQGIESLPWSLAEIKKAAEENSPRVREASLMVDEGATMVALARKERLPNFVLEGGWEYKGKLPSMYEIMVGLEIPLYYKTKQSQMLAESLMRLRSSESGLAAMKNDLTSMLTEDYIKGKSAETLIRLYRDRIIPQAQLTVESSLASYQVGKTDFLALLADINTHFSYQMAFYRELVELWGAIARLEENAAKKIVNWGGKNED